MTAVIFYTKTTFLGWTLRFGHTQLHMMGITITPCVCEMSGTDQHEEHIFLYLIHFIIILQKLWTATSTRMHALVEKVLKENPANPEGVFLDVQ